MTGLAYETSGRIDVHPLAKDFLLAKLAERADCRELANKAFDLAVAKGLYDVAFDGVRKIPVNDLLERLVTESYPDLIQTGRIETLA
ncbi:MAG TPA: hypothetical protein VH913_20160, partial [Hyphomicrobiaceae bacterium]